MSITQDSELSWKAFFLEDYALKFLGDTIIPILTTEYPQKFPIPPSDENTQITDNISEASIIICNSENSKNFNTSTRIIKSINQKKLVHTSNLPSSYDVWLPKSENEDQSIKSLDYPKQTIVSFKWLIDSSEFLEWMDPQDYIIQDYLPETQNVSKIIHNTEQSHTHSPSNENKIGNTIDDNNVSASENLNHSKLFLYSDRLARDDFPLISQSTDPTINSITIDNSVELNSQTPNVKVVNINDLDPKLGFKKRNEYEPIASGQIGHLNNDSVIDKNSIAPSISNAPPQLNEPMDIDIPSAANLTINNNLSSHGSNQKNIEFQGAGTQISDPSSSILNNEIKASSIPSSNNQSLNIDSTRSVALEQDVIMNASPKSEISHITEQAAINNHESGKEIDDSSIKDNKSLDPPNGPSEHIITIKQADISEQLVPDSATKAEQVIAEQKYEIIIPSYSAWFDLSTIHINEKKSNPEFFNGINKSKTPVVYTEYRNFMINAYRLCPHEYLTVTACRRNLAGDVCSIMRVHAFLEQWGLINYQVDPETKPSLIAPPFTGHFKVTADTPRGLAPFFPNVPVYDNSLNSHEQTLNRKNSNGQLNSIRNKSNSFINRSSDPIDPKNNLYNSQASINNLQNDKKISCFTCGNSLDDSRYHCIKPIRQQIDLCSACFLDGRFPSFLNSADFVKLNENNTKNIGVSNANNWTDQETLLLLEGIEMYDEDWTKISEHVGTRSKEECVLCFLQLPIEDSAVVGNYDDNLLPRNFNSSEDLQYIPFSKADNPVMSVVAFLASNVNPAVAAAAAKEALRVLTTIKKGSTSASKNIDLSHESSPSDSLKLETDAPELNVKQLENSAEIEINSIADVNSQQKTEANNSDIKPYLDAPDKDSQQVAAALALGAAAAKASQLADREEAAMQLLVHQAIELQLAKLEYKVKILEEMQQTIEQERYELAKQRIELAEERIAFIRDVEKIEGIKGLGSDITSIEPSSFSIQEKLQSNDVTVSLVSIDSVPNNSVIECVPAPEEISNLQTDSSLPTLDGLDGREGNNSDHDSANNDISMDVDTLTQSDINTENLSNIDASTSEKPIQLSPNHNPVDILQSGNIDSSTSFSSHDPDTFTATINDTNGPVSESGAMESIKDVGNENSIATISNNSSLSIMETGPNPISTLGPSQANLSSLENSIVPQIAQVNENDNENTIFAQDSINLPAQNELSSRMEIDNDEPIVQQNATSEYSNQGIYSSMVSHSIQLSNNSANPDLSQ
ncbi:Chromatin structure-remodeling complex protein RSC8 [Smittium culicis]|uniref:Chromatin structure-remodeling complex protein RSC8 n=1 Tax=Smittium culicis TaxID=133412 RepID=A0A1R1YIW2_9FUNG|nr:Chromatin structure-remodeling complex protein RSC8 [Smittium culicis]